MPLRIIDLHERDVRVFPRSELFDSKGQTLVLAETRALAAVDLRDIAAGVELRARGIIGYLPLTTDIVLNIRPKFPVANLWAMLEVADETYDRIFPLIRSYESFNGSPPHQLLARSFCHYLKEILRLGVARGYYPEVHKGHFKPKVNFGRTVSSFLSRGNDVDVCADVFVFSAKLKVNGILRSACINFLRVMPRIDTWNEERLIVSDAINALDAASPLSMQPGDEGLADALPAWCRAPYRGALTVYSMLLGFTKVGFSYAAVGNQMPSFLFSLDAIFESFIRNTFRRVMRGRGIAVVDGNMPRHQGLLFTDNKRFPIKPDLIFKRGNVVIGMAEVKYKPRIEEADRYQVISHVVSMGLPMGFWISPVAGGEAGVEYIGAIRTGARFFHYRLDLAAKLDASALQMVEEVHRLLEPALG